MGVASDKVTLLMSRMRRRQLLGNLREGAFLVEGKAGAKALRSEQTQW